MKLNTKMRYGTRALLELALHHEQGALSLGQIAAAQGISEKYLEALLAMLRNAGLVQSQRGPQGGYRLARPPDKITLREVWDVLEGPEAFVPCTQDPTLCERWTTCVTQEIWAEMYAAALQVLEKTTLADLVARGQQRLPDGGMYII